MFLRHLTYNFFDIEGQCEHITKIHTDIQKDKETKINTQTQSSSHSLEEKYPLERNIMMLDVWHKLPYFALLLHTTRKLHQRTVWNLYIHTRGDPRSLPWRTQETRSYDKRECLIIIKTYKNNMPALKDKLLEEFF